MATKDIGTPRSLSACATNQHGLLGSYDTDGSTNVVPEIYSKKVCLFQVQIFFFSIVFHKIPFHPVSKECLPFLGAMLIEDILALSSELSVNLIGWAMGLHLQQNINGKYDRDNYTQIYREHILESSDAGMSGVIGPLRMITKCTFKLLQQQSQHNGEN